jgi:hypothetical protein
LRGPNQPAFVRWGGSGTQGGKARAAKLSAKKRLEIAKKAAAEGLELEIRDSRPSFDGNVDSTLTTRPPRFLGQLTYLRPYLEHSPREQRKRLIAPFTMQDNERTPGLPHGPPTD